MLQREAQACESKSINTIGLSGPKQPVTEVAFSQLYGNTLHKASPIAN